MNTYLDWLCDSLRQHGTSLLLGITLVLGTFALLVRFNRSVSTKYRLASTAMLAALAYLTVAILPLPRIGVLPSIGSLPSSGALATRGLASTPPTTTPALAPTATPEQPAPRPPAISIDEYLFAATDPATAVRDIQTAVAPRTASLDLTMWLAIALSTGALLFLAHLLLGWWRLRRILKQSQPAPPELQQLIDLPARTRLRITHASIQPFCCGLLKPTIVLPRRLAHATEEARFILLHERAHLTSGDARARLLTALLRPVLFWHPIYWWLQRQLRFTSELLADDQAAQGSIGDYVRCMMTLSTHPDRVAGGMLVATIFQRRSELFRRLEMMLQRSESITHSQTRLSRCTRAVATLALVAISAGTFGVERAVAQAPQSQEVHEQVLKLRAEIASLQAEIASLRAAGQPSAQPRSDAPTPGQPRKIRGQRPATAAIPSTESADGIISYTVKSGDTMAKIAERFYGSEKGLDELRKLNPDCEPARLRPGQQVNVRPLRTIAPAAPVAPLPPIATTTPHAAPRAIAGEGSTAPSSLNDLSELVSRCLELRGDVEIQEVQVRHADSPKEKEIAQIKLRTKKSQYEALLATLRSELHTTEMQRHRNQRLHDNGLIPSSELHVSDSRVQLLKRALR
jgi:beta-lactamase regulating signal transducer with metallopeptidase domain/LysM repeat protein